MPPFSGFFHLLLWLSLVFNSSNLSKAATIPKPDCPTECGSLTVPYPFGIGVGTGCSVGFWYDINCNTTFDPPKPFLFTGNLEVLEISASKVRVKNVVASTCYSETGTVTGNNTVSISLKGAPYTFSQENRFTVIGCGDFAIVGDGKLEMSTGCTSICSQREDLIDRSCSGIGCCQTVVPKGMQDFFTSVLGLNAHQGIWSFNPCSYAFIGDQNSFMFSKSDLSDPTLGDKINEDVPLVLEWAIGNQNCSDVQNSADFVCQQNSECINVDNEVGGYRCKCVNGYQGNPYVSSGCLDVNECIDSPCHPKGTCSNFPGGFNCTCPGGYVGDGRKDGQGCTSEGSSFPVKQLSLGLSFGFLALIMSTVWLYYTVRKRKQLKLRQKYFHQNGGVLLKQKMSSNGVNSESARIFKLEELKKATRNYSRDYILGEGGFGIVFKGILDDQRVVAIKTSKKMDESEVESFINEVVILTQVNHRNVVKLFGCCLETEVPQLVYECVSNGTLSEHIEKSKEMPWFSFEWRIRIAYESALAFAYLHSAASPPIIHRDVKSANILLDDHYVAKVSDFGASRLIPLDQTRVATVVMGTMGYLDPEYLNSGQLTEKSDVYSFGVILAELLTGKKPSSPGARITGEGTLANYFTMCKKQGYLFDILEPRMRREGTVEKINAVAELVIRCLELEGEERPTMKQVAVELERVGKLAASGGSMEEEYDEGNAETVSLISEQQDMYSVHSNLHLSDVYTTHTTN
ncbi:transmembrane signal receptor [Lithospermum erythrorhizon]|uniref:Transmembrane signal receptor n=1 Tax=Lithospermum erythrorhizon TaxID=34254 RepID=A0AAV3PCG6_LITER